MQRPYSETRAYTRFLHLYGRRVFKEGDFSPERQRNDNWSGVDDSGPERKQCAFCFLRTPSVIRKWSSSTPGETLMTGRSCLLPWCLLSVVLGTALNMSFFLYQTIWCYTGRHADATDLVKPVVELLLRSPAARLRLMAQSLLRLTAGVCVCACASAGSSGGLGYRMTAVPSVLTVAGLCFCFDHCRARELLGRCRREALRILCPE